MENLNNRMMVCLYSNLGGELHREVRCSLNKKVSSLIERQLLRKFWKDIDLEFNRLITNQLKHGKYQ
jgi:hypothetical protein